MADIFISYAHTDRDKVEMLAAALEAECYSVWWDRHLQSGSEFSADIERELNDAKAVIACWSEEGAKSRWVKDEANIAADAGKLFAIMLDKNPPPIGFRQYHALDFSTWSASADSAAFMDLVQALKTRVSDELPGRASPRTVDSPAQSIDNLSGLLAKDWKVWTGALFAVFVLAIVGWMGLRGLNSTANDESFMQPRIQNSVAVLPFTNLSSNPEHEIFAAGLTEEILYSLDNLPELHVSGRASSFYFNEYDIPIQEIAERLGVLHIVEGSVRRSGDRLRVTAQLIRASDGFRLWSEIYDRPATDIFAVQEDIAVNIAGALEIILDEERRTEMFAFGTRNVEAFQTFLKGRLIYDRAHRLNSIEDHWEANLYFSKAVRIDPNFSTAYGYHHDAYAHFLMQDFPSQDEELTNEEALKIIREDFAQTLKFLPDSDSVMGTQITAALFTDSWRRIPEFVEKLDAIYETGRHEVRGVAWSNALLISVGRSDLMLRRAELELERDPFNPVQFSAASNAALALGDYDRALDYARRGLEVAPGHILLERSAAIAYALSGELDEAARLLRQHSEIEIFNGLAAAFSGDHSQAREIALRLTEKNPHDAKPIFIFAELGDEAEVSRLTRIIDESPLGALSFLRLIESAGGLVVFDMAAAPNFRARLLEAGGDPEKLKPWMPISPRSNL